MVCQNCQSSDIVTIQRQNYCINCGNIVTSTPNVPVPPPVKAPQAPVVANSNATTSAQTNPKASSQSTPISLKVTQRTAIKTPVKSTTATTSTATSPAPASKSENVLSSVKASPKLDAVTIKAPALKNTGLATKSKQQSPRVEPTVKPMPKHLQHTAAQVRQMKDLRPLKTTTSAPAHTPRESKSEITSKAVPIPAQDTITPTQTASHPAVIDSVPSSFRCLVSACKLAWSRANTWRFLKFGLATVLSVALPMMLLLLSGQTFTLSIADLPITTLLGIGSCWLAAYLISVLAGNNVIYGSIKLSDNRTADPSHWRSAALASLWPVVGLDISIIFLMLLAVMSSIGLDSLLSLLNLSEFTGLIAQRVIIGLAIYTIFSLWLIRQLARCAIVTGSTRVFNAIELAFFTWRKQTSLVLTSGLTAVFSYLLMVFVGFVVTYGFSQGLSNFEYALPNWLQMVAALSLGWFLVGLVIVFNWSFWQAIYRQSTKRYTPAEQSRLLAGRVVERSHVWARALFLVTTIILLVLGGYLLW